jgi:chlorite dismutase
MKFHNYIFLSPHPGIQEVSKANLAKYKKEFLIILESKDVSVSTYATLGFKGENKILLWLQSDNLEAIQDNLNQLMQTNLGRNLKINRTLFGMTRPTQYSPKSTGHLETEFKGKKYLTIYPFTKMQSWYNLDFDERKNLMWGHVQFGKKHPAIEQLLLYSYGVDDQEFIVSYEMDDLEEFQTLVMELRLDKVRNYTQKDTPIFTCIYKSPEEVLEYL